MIINISDGVCICRDFEKVKSRTFTFRTFIRHIFIISRYYPSVRIIDLVPDTTYVVCVNFIRNWRDRQFKVVSEQQIFIEKLFMAILFTLRAFSRNLLRGNRRINTFYIFCFNVWFRTQLYAQEANTLPTRLRRLFTLYIKAR